MGVVVGLEIWNGCSVSEKKISTVTEEEVEVEVEVEVGKRAQRAKAERRVSGW